MSRISWAEGGLGSTNGLEAPETKELVGADMVMVVEGRWGGGWVGKESNDRAGCSSSSCRIRRAVTRVGGQRLGLEE